MTLSEDLADWRDWDVAAHAYGLAIGVFDGSSRRQITRVVLSENRLGRGLHAGVMALVEAGVLERRDDPEEQYRWVYDGAETLAGAPGSWESLPVDPQTPDLAPVEKLGAAGRWWKRGRG